MELTASKLILSRPFSSDSGVLLTGLYEFHSFVHITLLHVCALVCDLLVKEKCMDPSSHRIS
jgi:hypothetical protein